MKIKGSIRRRLIISLVLLAIIPLLLMGALLSWQSFVIQQRQLVELQKEKARRVLHQIGSIIHAQEKDLNHALTIDHYILDAGSEKQRNILAHLLSFSDENNISIFNEIALLDSGGRELARQSRTSIITPDDLRDRSNADEFTVPVASRQTYYGPVSIDDKTGTPFMLMSIPIIDTRTDIVQGVLAAEMRMKFMWDIVDRINIGEAGLVYIVDTTGRVIVHPNPSVVLKGRHYDIDNKSGIAAGLDGAKAVLTNDIFKLGARHLHVVTEIPLVRALKSTYTSLLTIAVFLVLTLTGSFILGYIIVRQVIRPVESLSETARAISSGDISRRSDISGKDELGVLSDTFNLMTSRLAETITSLKSEIAGKENAEKKIRLAYEEWQRTFDSISHPVSIHDRDSGIIRANKVFTDFFKTSSTELIGKKCHEIYHGTNEPWPGCPHARTMKAGITCTEELFEPNLNKYLRVTTSPILNDSGEITGSVHIAEDITERKHAELALSESEQRYQALFEKAPYAIMLIDGETGELLEFNYKAHKNLGYTREEFRKLRIHDFEVFESEGQVQNHINKIIEQGHDIFETKHRRKDGGIRDILVNCHAIILGRKKISLSILIDITERKDIENKIKSSLREKDILLKEIHHRVKNNMQVISSLLKLQAGQISDKKYVELFNESRNRITSMALVHEKLYNSKDLANVDFKDYISSLISDLFTFYGTSADKVLMNMSVEDIRLSIDTAIPCGLIINELVSNSLKYAFPEEKKGELKIVLDKAGTGDNDAVYSLVVSDNGIGIPEGINIRETKSLGLQLVINLTEHQLQGGLQFDRAGGTSFRIRFRDSRYKNRI